MITCYLNNKHNQQSFVEHQELDYITIINYNSSRIIIDFQNLVFLLPCYLTHCVSKWVCQLYQLWKKCKTLQQYAAITVNNWQAPMNKRKWKREPWYIKEPSPGANYSLNPCYFFPFNKQHIKHGMLQALNKTEKLVLG